MGHDAGRSAMVMRPQRVMTFDEAFILLPARSGDVVPASPFRDNRQAAFRNDAPDPDTLRCVIPSVDKLDL
ncbi:hypothetical protein [Jannaschia donghaensis]|uniref:hypothetical protein n=1 Tax=Jannaschia donghaensis TaxID=420998 RepID=UPI0034D1E916